MGPNSGYYEDIYWWGTGSEEKTESNLIKSSKLLVGDYFGCSSHFNELLVLLLLKQFIRKCGFCPTRDYWLWRKKTFNQVLGKPLFVFEMCCFHRGIARQRKGGGVKTGEDGFGHFFHVCPFDRGGRGSKAIWALPIEPTHSNRGFPILLIISPSHSPIDYWRNAKIYKKTQN